MKIWTIALLLSALNAAGQGMPDGPYVIYRNGQTVVKTITNRGGQLSVTADSAARVSQVSVPGYFKVPLRDDIMPEPPVTQGSRQMLFISDIEGQFDGLRALLLGNQVIDKNYRWIFGRNKLIIAGDLFDRGCAVLPVLWLLYKLEGEARAAGGDVRIILGNHDLMNFSGDLRYVQPEYLENARLLGENYTTLFGRHSLLGRWLRRKNIIEKSGDILVCHAGVSPQVNAAGWPLSRINTRCREHYDQPVRELPDSTRTFLGYQGVHWYRGYFLAPRATPSTIDSTLNLFKAKYIVVGHTIITGRNPALYYQGKVIGIDVNAHKGNYAAVLFRNGRWYAADKNGRKRRLRYLPANDQIRPEEID